MAVLKLISEQGSLHDELTALCNANEKRKSLIALSCLKLLTLSSKSSGSSKKGQKADVSSLMQKNTDYELYINKLKQEYSKSEKLQQAKMENLRDEVTRLREQLRTSKSNGEADTGMQFRAPVRSYNLRQGSAGNDTMKAPLTHRSTSAAPSTANSSNRTLVSADKGNDDILTPVRPKMGVKQSMGRKREYVNYNTLKKNLEKTSTDNSGSQQSQASPTKTPTRKSFVENFDRSSESRSPSPDFTPSRLKPHEVPLPESPTNGNPRAKHISNTSHSVPIVAVDSPSRISINTNVSGILSDDDTFQSANGSLSSMVSSDIPRIKSKRKKKLKLWKAEASKLAMEKKDTTQLENEDLNSLNYYDDANFTNRSPETASQKRKTDEEHDSSGSPPRKKQKNVFTID